jgi:hypothetical protein
MTRPLHAVLPTIGLIGLTIWWITVAGGQSPVADGRDRSGAGIDPRSLDFLGDKSVLEKLRLSDDQRHDVERRLALCLNGDQKDLIQMIVGQFHADRGRLHDLEDPLFEDDEEEMWDERTRLTAMAGGLENKAITLVDRVLTPVQRDALGPRHTRFDLETLLRRLSALQEENAGGITAILTSRQRDQLRHIALESDGRLVFFRPGSAAGMNLRRDQEAMVRSICARAKADLDQLRAPSPISPAYRYGDDLEVWMKPRLPKIRKDSAKILLDASEEFGKVLMQ